MQSTGRGGAGNIGKSDVEYTDGGVVREGPYGEPGIPGGEYTSGRGGAGNTHPDAKVEPGASAARRDDVYVPETNLRDSPQPDFHTGRGGQGNVHKDKYGGHSTKAEQDAAGTSKKGLGEKVKEALHIKK